MPALSSPVLLVVSAALAFGAILACAHLLVSILNTCREGNVVRHVAVAVTVVPLAFVLSTVLIISYNGLTDNVHTFAKEHQHELPSYLVYAAAAMRPLSGAFNLTETMWMACLLFTAYGVANVFHHLIDVLRLLKASRRRLLLPEMRALRKEEAAAATAGRKLR